MKKKIDTFKFITLIICVNISRASNNHISNIEDFPYRIRMAPSENRYINLDTIYLDNTNF